MNQLRVLGAAGRLSVAEFFGFWSPRTYAIVWVPRLVFQTAFFALLATFVGGPELLRFALVGNAAYLTCQAVLTMATASMQWELGAGTVPLLVASPANPLVVFIGRNLAMAAHGVASGIVTLFIATLFGLDLGVVDWVGAVAILVLIAGTSYALASLLGSLVLRFTAYRNAVSSLVGFALLAIAGINVPLTVLPEWLQTLALSLPCEVFWPALQPQTSLPRSRSRQCLGWRTAPRLTFRFASSSMPRVGQGRSTSIDPVPLIPHTGAAIRRTATLRAPPDVTRRAARHEEHVCDVSCSSVVAVATAAPRIQRCAGERPREPSRNGHRA
jgi:ABC-2 type transport system permease protein